MATPPPIVLTFAASDPTSGAGMQADLLTLASLGCHPVSVLTALTVQDTRGVRGLLAIEPRWVADQAQRLLDDLPVAAFKLGVLGSARNVEAIAAILARHPKTPVVLDPVLASGRGDPLASADTVQALCKFLLARTTVLTPNSLEARLLAGAAADSDPAQSARRLVALGCKYVLVTGTHEAGAQVVNALYDARGALREDRWARLPESYHGSGCTLAAAIAALLANGLEVPEAVREAQAYTWQALAAGFRAGAGQLIPDRFFRARRVERAKRSKAR
ncbi:MAG: bifunctional hydroxymethylpyrimidine kinase/phosphomethylpyrimidine kinase [Burkholderiales bacterium]